MKSVDLIHATTAVVGKSRYRYHSAKQIVECIKAFADWFTSTVLNLYAVEGYNHRK
jgi:hypothetical protein